MTNGGRTTWELENQKETWHHDEGKQQHGRSGECKSKQRGHWAQAPAGSFRICNFVHSFLAFDFTWKPFISHFNLPINLNIVLLTFQWLDYLAADRWKKSVVDVEAVWRQDQGPKALKRWISVGLTNTMFAFIYCFDYMYIVYTVYCIQRPYTMSYDIRKSSRSWGFLGRESKSDKNDIRLFDDSQ